MNGGRQRGFSLLELLVTLFVVVLVTSLVTLNIGSGDRDMLLRAAVEALADSASYALDEAQFTGMNYGLMLHREDTGGQWRYRYDWWEQTPVGWRAPASGKGVFAPAEFPPGLELQLELDGLIQEQELLANNSEVPRPQIILYASGETVPGAIELRATDTGELLWRIEWNLLGNFQTLSRGQALVEEDF
ncbi:prepilin-type N-terminal cleavage/methylation domain-containing protein [Seongchinamella unica]|uniref:Prepilin-type N-terminal cleavage/methylation domain-containing protein n=1 Tax=Seongchinamella unica TaxID=2547392 RepID=A0A4R5LUK8_9GAMM|nr:GspH/FimT family pseudopilin [Seongchinamella unica]TDG15042.1 prepilin-type N-terminal cleavage/methylation domain-containing protein [Seongchinamella unica]